MAAKQLLPGYGSRYTSEAIEGSAAGTPGEDVIDTSRCSQFAVQMTDVTTGSTSTLQVQHTFDGVNWANLGSSTAIVGGAVLRFGANSGPYGKIRLVVTTPDDASEAAEDSSHSDSDDLAHVVFTVVGFEMQGKS